MPLPIATATENSPSPPPPPLPDSAEWRRWGRGGVECPVLLLSLSVLPLPLPLISFGVVVFIQEQPTPGTQQGHNAELLVLVSFRAAIISFICFVDAFLNSSRSSSWTRNWSWCFTASTIVVTAARAPDPVERQVAQSRADRGRHMGGRDGEEGKWGEGGGYNKTWHDTT